MAENREDWQDWLIEYLVAFRDVLSSYVLALKPTKICAGYLTTAFGVFVISAASFLYALCARWGLVPGYSEALADLGAWWDPAAVPLPAKFALGQGMEMLGTFAVLLNPFYTGGIGHFVLSIATYCALFFAVSGGGGIIARLTALEYACDDLPTFADGRQMVRSHRSAYFLAPVLPLLFLAGLAVLNLLGGLVASIPYVGRILLVFPGMPLLFITSVLMVMIALFGVLSFGLMMPAVSVGGKDALDGWSTSYTYVLWGSGRFIWYTLWMVVVGIIGAVAAYWLTELLIYLLVRTVNLGFVSSKPWIDFTMGGMLVSGAGGGLFNSVISNIIALLLLAVRGLPVAFVVSFFFTANTIIFLRLRKHVDNIDIEEVYQEAEEEEELVTEPAAEEPVPEEEPTAPEAPPAPEQAPEAEEGLEEEAPPAEEEEPAPEEEEAAPEEEQAAPRAAPPAEAPEEEPAEQEPAGEEEPEEEEEKED
ncbi:MAG: hypothetical protein ACOC7T_00250 [Planctomycetota bacterium]